jgi:hypothetical protein
MNHLFKLGGSVTSLFLVLLLAALAASPVMAKVDCENRPDHPLCADDPVDPPPEPDPDPDPSASCANSGSNFPAFVYEVQDQLFLSDATGDCTIAIYKTERQTPWGKSFRYFPDDGDLTSGHGHLAWLERDETNQPMQLYTAEFHVDNGSIVETLPLTPTPLMAEESYITNPALSANASQIYFAGRVGTPEQHFIDVIDLDTEERSRVFETTADEYTPVVIYGLEPGLDDKRMYFSLWPLYAPDGSIDWTQSLVYIERDGDGNWPEIAYDASDTRLGSEPTEIMVDDDRHGDALSVGFWDHDGDGELNTVLSWSTNVDFWEVEILDIENCVNGDEPCIVLGTRSASGLAYEGDRPSLTSFSEYPPSLLHIRYDAVQLDLDTGVLQTLIKAKNKNLPVSEAVSAD